MPESNLKHYLHLHFIVFIWGFTAILGKLISIDAVTDADDLMIINKSGLTIRMAVEDLRVMGRATQGVKLINIKGNDSIAAVTKVMKDDPAEVELDEDGNPIEVEVIERVKPVLEVLEDDGSDDDDDDDDDEVIEDDDAEDDTEDDTEDDE